MRGIPPLRSIRPFAQLSITATHDSIGLGEDGPTHQPVETAAHFRAIPNLDFWRPADGNETSASYLVAIQSRETPSILSLSRQNLPNLEGSTIEQAARGGYVLYEVDKEDLTIVSSGSEVPIALEAASKLKQEGVRVRVVSLPCWSVFDKQDKAYRLSVLRSGAPILSLEALSTVGWQKYSHEASVGHRSGVMVMLIGVRSNTACQHGGHQGRTRRCTRNLVSRGLVRTSIRMGDPD